MAIIRNVYEKLKGAFKVLIGSAVAVGLADALKGIIKDKGIKAAATFIESLATGKGLGNEAVYGEILDRLNLKTEQRALLIRASQELRAGTEKEKQAADNFIILVALGNPDPKTGQRPGERIINGFIHRIDEYPDDTAKVKMIKDNIIHIGTDAETKAKIAVVQKWAIEAWGKLLPLLDSGAEKIGNGISFVVKKVDRKYDERLARSFERSRRRQENIANWLNPLLWLEWFIDLR